MVENQKKDNLTSGFIQAVSKFPDCIALEVDDRAYTYQELGRAANNIAAAIKTYEVKTNQLVSVLAYRSPTAYAGILGTLISGKGYVPLNPEFPTDRTFRMLSLSKTSVIVVGKECLKRLREILPLVNALRPARIKNLPLIPTLCFTTK